MKDKLSGTRKDLSIRAAMAPLSLSLTDRQTDTHVHTRAHTQTSCSIQITHKK